tara:strand:+ start:337 stop:570 length:234 start_codon:yes stop_codon:yes gene_type:complete
MEFEEMIRKNKKMSNEAKEKAIHSYYKKHPKEKVLSAYFDMTTRQKIELEFRGIAKALGIKVPHEHKPIKKKGAKLM